MGHNSCINVKYLEVEFHYKVSEMISARAIWDKLQPYETVLIEYSSRVEPTPLFYELLNWAKEKGCQVIVDDVLDTLYQYKVQLDLAGKDTSILNDVKVIKLGGRFNVGQLIGRIKIKEPTVREHEYRKISESLPIEGGSVVNFVLGFERIFSLAESVEEVLHIMNQILSFVGDKIRIAFYFMNTDVLESTVPEALNWIEELATTIVEVGREGKLYKFSVVKSVNNELSGLEFTLP